MKMITQDEAYHNLANAIILQAIKDYKNGYKRKEVIEFFRSGWFKELTDIPASSIIRICRDKDVKASFKW